jgi:integrase
MPTRDPLASAEEYAVWVRRTGLADQSQDAYTSRVTAFCRWLAERPGDYGPEVWTDEHVRDYAVRDYRRELLTGPEDGAVQRRRAPVRGRLAVHLVRHRQAAGARRRATAERVQGPVDDEVRKVLRAAERAGPREHALVALGVLAGPRVGEIVPLDADDIAITERSGVVSIRYGKGGKPRRVPLPPQAREALSAWQAERRTLPGRSGARRCSCPRAAAGWRSARSSTPCIRSARRWASGCTRTSCGTRSRAGGSSRAGTSPRCNECSGTPRRRPR